MKVIFKEIKKEKDFDLFKTAWEALESGREMTGFQSFEWDKLLYKKWQKVPRKVRFPFRTKLFVAALYNGSDIKMLVPLLVYKKDVINDTFEIKKGIYFFGDNTQSDYLNFIYHSFEEKELVYFLDEIKKRFWSLPIAVNKIRKDTSVTGFFLKYKKDGSVHNNVGVTIYNTRGEYEDKLSKNVRQNLRTAVNRIKKNNVNYELSVLTGPQDSRLATELYKMHEERVKTIRKKEYDSLHSTKYKKRLLNIYKYVRKSEKRFNLVIEAMKNYSKSFFIIVKLNGEIAGHIFGIRDSMAIRVIFNCFDEKYTFYSPMFYGAYDFISNECENHLYGIKELDFTLGDEEYKIKLGGSVSESYNFSY